jgi:acetyl esterase/lipase
MALKTQKRRCCLLRRIRFRSSKKKPAAAMNSRTTPGSVSAQLALMVPKIPLMLHTVAWHSLGWSSTAYKWDLKTEFVIKLMRSFVGVQRIPIPISVTQANSLHDPGVKGKLWVSRYTIPKPAEDDVRDALFRAFDALSEHSEVVAAPDVAPVEVEWHGNRAGAADTEPEPADMSEADKYTNLMAEVTSDVTILYLHGGGFYVMDPASHRPATSRLARLTGGRAMSVRYRLSPQNSFPAALIDVFCSYLALLHPPADAPHGPVEPENIILSGDSAGGNLCLALLQLVLQLHRSAPAGETPTVLFNGTKVQVPLPGGLALLSPWCDITGSSDSITRNAEFDYLCNVWLPERIPDCHLWPTDPPRADVYAPDCALAHPLVSPLSARDWMGAPPIRFMVGQELLSDECAAIATLMARQGVTVAWEDYEAMPHCFAYILDPHPVTAMAFEGWAAWITDVVKGRSVVTNGTHIAVKTLERTEVDVLKLAEAAGIDEAQVIPKMRANQERGVSWFRNKQEERAAAKAAETAAEEPVDKPADKPAE